jgi:SAM-dependent methyltransferase
MAKSPFREKLSDDDLLRMPPAIPTSLDCDRLVMRKSNTLKVLGGVISSPKRFAREWKQTQHDLTRTKDELSFTKHELAQTRAELDQANSQILFSNDPAGTAPSHQAALDLFKGTWYVAMPPDSGLLAGTVGGHFDVAPVRWADNHLGGLAGKSILELGPFEAYQTYQFERLGAGSVLSIENSPANFLKCLIIKNIYSLRATFLLGNFIQFLETPTDQFDICWASGVLYHMTDPLRFLEAVSRVSDTVVVNTHFFSEKDIAQNPYAASFFDGSKDQSTRWRERDIILHYRSYLGGEAARASNRFCGGSSEFSFWMELADIKVVLTELGYTHIEMEGIYPSSQNGPACFFAASRKR